MIPAFTLGGAVGRAIKTKTLPRTASTIHLWAFRRYENNKIVTRSLTSRESPEAAAGWNMFVDYF